LLNKSKEPNPGGFGKKIKTNITEEKKRMKTKILVSLCLVWAMVMFSPLQPVMALAKDGVKRAQDNKNKNKNKAGSETVKAGTGETARGGTDPNIKEDVQMNDKTVKRELPTNKGGKTRGGGNCEVQLDNWTNWNIKIYINGSYRGTVSGGDEQYLYYTPGRVTIYARADFNDGSYLYWGPKTWSCGSNQYVYFKMTE
jgi:hypothetical protein